MNDQIIEIPVINISAKTGLINIGDNVSEKSQTSNKTNQSALKQTTDCYSPDHSIEPVHSPEPEEPPEHSTEIQQAPELTTEENLESSHKSPEQPMPEEASDSPKPPTEETKSNVSKSPKPEEITQDLPPPEEAEEVVSQALTPSLFQVIDPSELISYRPLYRTQFIWAYVNMLLFLPLLIWIPGFVIAMYSKKYYRINEFIMAKKFVKRTKVFNIFTTITGKFIIYFIQAFSNDLYLYVLFWFKGLLGYICIGVYVIDQVYFYGIGISLYLNSHVIDYEYDNDVIGPEWYDYYYS